MPSEGAQRFTRALGRHMLAGLLLGLVISCAVAISNHGSSQDSSWTDLFTFGSVAGALAGGAFLLVSPLRRHSLGARFVSWIIIAAASVGVYLFPEIVQAGFRWPAVRLWSMFVALWGVGLGIYDYFWYRHLERFAKRMLQERGQ